ncbi:MAG: hypothetical protein J6R42_04175 [Clostridia bacterium]|nr:hypothetical protein [Clostridia bacterium]
MQKNEFSPLRRLTMTALMAALGTALAIMSKFLFGDLPVRIDLAVLPVLVVAYFLGPVESGIAYVLIDVLSSVFFYPPFLPITLAKLVAGLYFGFLLKKCSPSPTRYAILFLVYAVLLDWLYMSFALYWLQKTSIVAIMLLRAGQAAIDVVVGFSFMYFVLPKLRSSMKSQMRANRK